MYALLSGTLMGLSLVASLLFFRALRRTKDKLFAYFGLAFFVFAMERFLLGLTERPNVDDPVAYIPRILAFSLILYAIVDRNRR